MPQGKLRAPPSGHHVPRWLHRLLVRGLASDPARRFSSMDALLAQVTRGQARARARKAVATFGALALLGAGAEGARRYDLAQRAASCRADGAAFVATWDDAARRRVRDGLLATGASYAQSTVDKTLPRFDAQARALQDANTQACMATRVRHEWDEELLSRAVWCLDERRMELESLADELAQADATALRRAALAAAGLSPVAPCQDAAMLARLPDPPRDRQGVAALRRDLSRAWAMEASGDYTRGGAIAHDALGAARHEGWPPLLAVAHLRQGSILAKSGDYDQAEARLEDAFVVGMESGALAHAADAASQLTYTVGYEQARYPDGKRWARLGQVALAQLGAGPNDPRRAALAHNLAAVDFAMGAYDEARRLDERALSIWETALGPEHPSVATSLNNLAVLDQDRGDHGQAKVLLQRALSILQGALGPEHPDVATAMNNLADSYRVTGDLGRARELLSRALEIWEAALGPDHPHLAFALTGLGELDLQDGEYAAARSRYERALHIWEKSLGPEHPLLAHAVVGLAEVALAQGRPAQALPLARRALELREGGKVTGPPLARTRFVLARALWAAPKDERKDRERALVLAQSAWEGFRAAKGHEDDTAKVRSWLSERGAAPAVAADERPASSPPGNAPG